MSLIIKVIAAVVGILIIFLLLGFLDGFVMVPFYLVTGWFFFLKRTLPEIVFNLGGIAFATFCSVLIVAGIHWFAGWFISSRAEETSEGSHRPKWKWRWSFGIFLFVCLLFVSSIGTTGMFHQVGWLMSSKEPFIVNKSHRAMNYHEMKSIALDLLLTATAYEWKPAETQKAWNSGAHSNRPPSRPPLLEDWHVLLLQDENEKFASLIFHRNPQTRAKIGFAMVADETQAFLPVSKLQETLARFGIPSTPINPKK